MDTKRISWEEYRRIFGEDAVQTDGCITINEQTFQVSQADAKGFTLTVVEDVPEGGEEAE